MSSKRRAYERFQLGHPIDAVLRILRDVVVHRGPDGQLTAYGRTPGIVGEPMTLDLFGGGRRATVRVVVQRSAPVLVDGLVRHQLTLAVDEGRAIRPAEPAARGLEAAR